VPIKTRIVAALLVVARVGSAQAEAPGASEPPGVPEALRYDWKLDGALTVAAFGFWGGSELLKSHLAASSCRWCAVDGVDASIRSGLRWSDPSAADLASNLGAYAVVPLVGLGLTALAADHDGRLRETGGDGLVIAETVALAGDLSEIVKLATGRERPFVHALPAAEKPLTASPADNNVSFYSSHTSFVFALATASGTVASLRRYRLAPLVWAAGLASAATVGYLRIAADRHYFTDVLSGAVAGSSVGFAVPYGLHRTRGAVALVPAPGGGSELVFTARW
jgi:membrane-associated phospholipid phosphatase